MIGYHGDLEQSRTIADLQVLLVLAFVAITALNLTAMVTLVLIIA